MIFCLQLRHQRRCNGTKFDFEFVFNTQLMIQVQSNFAAPPHCLAFFLESNINLTRLRHPISIQWMTRLDIQVTMLKNKQTTLLHKYSQVHHSPAKFSKQHRTHSTRCWQNNCLAFYQYISTFRKLVKFTYKKSSFTLLDSRQFLLSFTESIPPTKG